MRTLKLADDVVATGALTTNQTMNRPSDGTTGVFQVSGITTATVVLEGRISSDHNWEAMATLTADGAVDVSLMPEVRVNVTAWTAGTIDADLFIHSH